MTLPLQFPLPFDQRLSSFHFSLVLTVRFSVYRFQFLPYACSQPVYNVVKSPLHLERIVPIVEHLL